MKGGLRGCLSVATNGSKSHNAAAAAFREHLSGVKSPQPACCHVLCRDRHVSDMSELPGPHVSTLLEERCSLGTSDYVQLNLFIICAHVFKRF